MLQIYGVDMNDIGETSLEEALSECRYAAQKGYSIAEGNLYCLDNDIKYMSYCLSRGLNSLQSSKNREKQDACAQIRDQISSLEAELKGLSTSSLQVLKERKESFDNFNITLFGRTMVGKSTLMEILTNGDGSSIGNGAQRTTRDVRSYQWKGMIVTDVPGVAAFEGQQDEEVAYESARNADIILFMISDDAPQPSEAECLAKLLELGKPVIGICNVKKAIDDERYMKSFLRNAKVLFDQKRLTGIYRQFNQLLAKYNPYARQHFIPAHLRARYLSVQKEYGEQKKALMDASRFRDIENSIIHAVTGCGKFYRIRNFIDSSVVLMLHLSDSMFKFSDQNSASGKIIVNKIRQLKIFEEQFRESGYAAIRAFVSKVTGQLRREADEFAESYYEDKDVSAKWNQIVKQKGIDASIQKLKRNLVSDCQDKMSDITQELENEIDFVLECSFDSKISAMEEITDYRRGWKWGTVIASGVIGVAAVFFAPELAPVVAVVGAMGGLGNLFFDSHEDKAHKQRTALSKKLYASISNIERALTKPLNEWFNKALLGKIRALEKDLHSVANGMFSLADAERNFALRLIDRQKESNRNLLDEVLRQCDATSYLKDIKDIARIPNSATMLLISPNVTLPYEIRRNLAKMLGEEILFVVDTQNEISILRQAIGKECKISIEKKIRIVHVQFKEVNDKTRIRLMLAQQLTGFHLMEP